MINERKRDQEERGTREKRKDETRGKGEGEEINTLSERHGRWEFVLCNPICQSPLSYQPSFLITVVYQLNLALWCG